MSRSVGRNLPASSRDQRGLGALEVHGCQPQRRVHRRRGGTSDAGLVRVDAQQHRPRRALRQHQQDVGVVPVEDVGGCAVEDPAAVDLPRRDGEVVGRPPAVAPGPDECGDEAAGSDAGEELRAGGLVAGEQERLCCEDTGAEQGGGRECGAELLEDHMGLEQREPGSAVLLGDRERRRAHLFAEHGPQRLVVPLRLGHGLADRLAVRPLAKEVADHRGELGLLLAQGEQHLRPPPVRR